jgi:hypothetical protein
MEDRQMSPANASSQAMLSEAQIKAIQAAIEKSIGAVLEVLLKKELKEVKSDIKLFPNGVDLIDVEAKIGIPNVPVFDFRLKIAGPGPHAVDNSLPTGT